MPPLVKGDRVMLTCEGRTVEAVVLLASPSGKSLAFGFEAILGGHVGTMLTFQDDDGVHWALTTTAPVTIERVS